jgi:hypothetical protein
MAAVEKTSSNDDVVVLDKANDSSESSVATSKNIIKNFIAWKDATKRTAPVWGFFRLQDKTLDMAAKDFKDLKKYDLICIICESRNKALGVLKWKRENGTKTLTQHVAKQHPFLFDTVCGDLSAEEESLPEKRLKIHDNGARVLQSMYDKHAAKAKPYALDDPKQMEYEKNLALKIACDYNPLSSVQQRFYKEEIKLLDPRLTIPSKHRITEVILPNLHNEVLKEHVLPVLEGAKYVSVSFDLWNNQSNNDVFSLVVHCIDAKSDFRSHFLTVLVFNFLMKSNSVFRSHFLALSGVSSTTGEVLAQVVLAKLVEFGLANSVSAYVTDKGANVVKAAKLLQEKTQCGSTGLTPTIAKCWAHILNLVLSKMLFPKVQTFYDTLLNLKTFSWKGVKGKLLEIIRWTRKSGKGTLAWKTSCETAGMPYRKLYRPVQTRFGNLVMMFRQLVNYRTAVTNLIMQNSNELAEKEPNAAEWTVVAEVVRLCEPIFKICMINQSRDGWLVTNALYSNMLGLKHLLTYSRGQGFKGREDLLSLEMKNFLVQMSTVGYEYLRNELKFLFEFDIQFSLYAFALIIDPRTRDVWMDLLDLSCDSNPFPKYHSEMKKIMKNLKVAKAKNKSLEAAEVSKYHKYAGELSFALMIFGF